MYIEENWSSAQQYICYYSKCSWMVSGLWQAWRDQWNICEWKFFVSDFKLNSHFNCFRRVNSIWNWKFAWKKELNWTQLESGVKAQTNFRRLIAQTLHSTGSNIRCGHWNIFYGQRLAKHAPSPSSFWLYLLSFGLLSSIFHRHLFQKLLVRNNYQRLDFRWNL